MTTNYVFAKNLRYLRRKKKLTQQEAANKIYISRSRFSQFEMGTAFPKENALLALCEIYEYTDIYSLMTKDIAA